MRERQAWRTSSPACLWPKSAVFGFFGSFGSFGFLHRQRTSGGRRTRGVAQRRSISHLSCDCPPRQDCCVTAEDMEHPAARPSPAPPSGKAHAYMANTFVQAHMSGEQGRGRRSCGHPLIWGPGVPSGLFAPRPKRWRVVVRHEMSTRRELFVCRTTKTQVVRSRPTDSSPPSRSPRCLWR